MTPKKRITVAEYVAQQLAVTEKTYREIGQAIGYDRPNFISMIKQGQSKLPISRAVPLAKVLGLDPAHFLRLVLQEYMPEVWGAVEEVLESSGREFLTAEEKQVLELVRTESRGISLALAIDANRERLARAVREIAEAEYREHQEIVRTVDALPSNSKARKGSSR